MPAAVWSGSLSFGLVNVAVRLVPATEPKDVRFHLYDSAGRRVRYHRVVDEGPVAEAARRPVDDAGRAEAEREDASVGPAEPASPDASGTDMPGDTPRAPVEREIGWEDVMRGHETETGEVVLLSREELERVRPERSRTIEVEDFVDLVDIDPVYFDKTYYAVPRSVDALKPYVLLHHAMRDAGRVGIGRFVLRTKPHLVAVRPMREVLAVETLFFGDEVRDPASLVPAPGDVEIDERELDLAMRLIDTLRTEWDPAAYADTYRAELLRLLAEKTPTPPVPEPLAGEGPSAVEQLMDALKRSVEAAKRERAPAKRRRERAG